VTPLLLALGASAVWGVVDFVGPLWARTWGTLRVLLWGQVGGFAAIGIAVAVRGDGPHGATVAVAAVAAARPALRLRPRDVAVCAVVGIGDTLGNVLYAASARSGLESLTAVLASLYPILTVALAAAVLRERIARGQRAGIVLTLAGVLLISV
jgi:uncharacterized membrane protein